MMRTISLISLIVFLTAAPFLYFGFGGTLWSLLWSIDYYQSQWTAFGLGCLIFIPTFFFAKRFLNTPWEYFATFEHEIAHMLVGFLFLKVPVSFKVTAHKGGEIQQVGFGNTGETWITLAPYFLPTLPLVLMVIGYLIEIDDFYFFAALGWLTVFHIVTNWSESSFRQPDLQKAGIAKTILIVPLMNLVFQGAILAFVGAGAEGTLGFLRDGAVDSWRFLVLFTDFVREYASTLIT
jgi:hypothetical protein